jgi:hypothetical protein
MALVEDLSKRVDVHDAVITDIVESIRQMVEAPDRGPRDPSASPPISRSRSDIVVAPG